MQEAQQTVVSAPQSSPHCFPFMVGSAATLRRAHMSHCCFSLLNSLAQRRVSAR